MTLVQIVERLLEDVEEYAHDVQSPELLLLVLRTAWLIQEDRNQSRERRDRARSPNEDSSSRSEQTILQQRRCQTRRARLES